MPVPDRFTVTPEPATAGDPVQICFTNSSLAGDTIAVGLDNGEGSATSVNITLDEHGYGCTSWTVPATGWDVIRMNQATSAEHVTVVQ